MIKINDHQKTLYETYDLQGCKRYFDSYEKYLARFSDKKNLKILDIGGASGHFALLLKQYFSENGVEVYVLDTMQYSTWAKEELGDKIHFICDSAENLSKLFSENTFDIIFANRVFHHLVDKTWAKTLRGVERCMNAIQQILKEDGLLCIMELFYNGMVFDSSTSFLIYSLTSIKNPAFSGIVKKLGAATAGIGVCFQSEKMWLRLLDKCGFQIAHIERSEYYKLPGIKRLGLLSKNVSRNNIICATPKKF